MISQQYQILWNTSFLVWQSQAPFCVPQHLSPISFYVLQSNVQGIESSLTRYNNHEPSESNSYLGYHRLESCGLLASYAPHLYWRRIEANTKCLLYQWRVHMCGPFLWSSSWNCKCIYFTWGERKISNKTKYFMNYFYKILLIFTWTPIWVNSYSAMPSFKASRIANPAMSAALADCLITPISSFDFTILILIHPSETSTRVASPSYKELVGEMNFKQWNL